MGKSLVLIKTKTGIIETECEVAKTPQEIAMGLSGRQTLSYENGMVFIFSEPTNNKFWMLNTNVPLSIAFFNEQGTILDIQDMKPNTIDPHAAPAQFIGALEMNAGWFNDHGVTAGDTITLPSSGYPLMLNEEVYYNNIYGRATHQGLEVWDIDEDSEEFLPWEEVNETHISHIYPRIIGGTIPEKKFSFNINKIAAAKGDFPALDEWRSQGFSDKHVEKRMEDFQKIFGTDYAGAVENVRRTVADARQKYPNDQHFENLGSFYDKEAKAVVDAGESKGFKRSTMSAVTARVSPGLYWWATSEDNPHMGNQQEPLNYAMVMKQLATTGVHVPETVRAYRTKPDKTRQEIVIPKGHHDLSTLTDEQIAFLPQIKNNSAALHSNRILAMNILRRDLEGKPMTLSEHIVASRKTPKPVSAEVQAPKITSFDKAVLLGKDAQDYVTDRHGFNIIGGKQLRGSSAKSFIDKAKSFSEAQKQPPGLRNDSGQKITVPDGSQFLGAIWEDARRLNEQDGIKMPRMNYQSTGWIHQIARTKDEPNKNNSFEDSDEKWDSPIPATRYIRSNHSGLFVPYQNHKPNDSCAQLHDFYSI